MLGEPSPRCYRQSDSDQQNDDAAIAREAAECARETKQPPGLFGYAINSSSRSLTAAKSASNICVCVSRALPSSRSR